MVLRDGLVSVSVLIRGWAAAKCLNKPVPSPHRPDWVQADKIHPGMEDSAGSKPEILPLTTAWHCSRAAGSGGRRKG